MIQIIDGSWVVIFICWRIFQTSLENYKIEPYSHPSGPLIFIFYNCPVDSTNLETARTRGPSISSSSSHNTLEVLAGAAEGFELSLLTRPLQQRSCKVSCIEAANRQEPRAPTNNPGKLAARVLKVAFAPLGKVGKTPEIWSRAGSRVLILCSLSDICFLLGEWFHSFVTRTQWPDSWWD